MNQGWGNNCKIKLLRSQTKKRVKRHHHSLSSNDSTVRMYAYQAAPLVMPWLAVSRCSPRQLIVASLCPVDCCFLMFEYFLNEKAAPLLTVRPRAAAMPLPMFCDVVITPCFCWLACWRSCSCHWLIVYFYFVKISPIASSCWHCHHLLFAIANWHCCWQHCCCSLVFLLMLPLLCCPICCPAGWLSY